MGEKNEKGKSNGVLFKIILLVLLILIVMGLGFVGYLLTTKKTSVTVNSNTALSEATKSTIETSPYTYKLDEFLLNLSDDGGKKYLKIKLSLGYDAKSKKNMDKELADKSDNMRDTILSILRSKKSTDISAQAGIDDLKKEILTKINPLFQSGKVNSVYIDDMLIQ